MVDAQSSYLTLQIEGFDVVKVSKAADFANTDLISFFKPSLRNFDNTPPDLKPRQYDVFFGTESGASNFDGVLNGIPFPVKNSDFDSSGEALFPSVFQPNRIQPFGFKAFPILQTEELINYDFLMYTHGGTGPSVDVFIKRVDKSFGPDAFFDISRTIAGANTFYGYDVVPIIRKTDLVGYDIIMVYEPV